MHDIKSTTNLCRDILFQAIFILDRIIACSKRSANQLESSTRNGIRTKNAVFRAYSVFRFALAELPRAPVWNRIFDV